MGRSARNLLLVAGLSVAVAVNLFARGVGVGIRAYRAEWIWRPLAKELRVHLMPAFLASAALVGLVWWLCRRGRWEEMRPWGRAMALAALVLVTFALQCALINAIGQPWAGPGAIIASPVTTTYFDDSRHVGPVGEYLARYHEIMPTLRYHAATHPPGTTLFFWAVRRACRWVPSSWYAESVTVATVQAYADFLGVGFPRSDGLAAVVSALLLALLGACTVVPVYLLTSRMTGAQAAGGVAACLTAGIPSLLLLSASSDQLVFFFAVRIVLLAYLAWKSERVWVSAAAGVLCAVGLFVSLGLLALVGWLLLWALFGWLRAADRGAALRRLAVRWAAGGAGFIGFYLALFLATGYRGWTVAYLGIFAHRQATTVEFPRTYWKWVLMNPVEMAVFAGLALVAAAAWAGIQRKALSPSLGVFLISWLAALAVLDVSGTVRGEVGRIWLFLMWPLAVGAGAAVAKLPERRLTATMLVAMQVCQALAMRAYLTMYDIT